MASVVHLCFLTLICFGFSEGASTLYGVLATGGGSGSQTVISAVSVDPSKGTLTSLANVLIYVGIGKIVDGLSAFDLTNQRIYFSNDFNNDFVYGYDIKKNVLLPPISINSRQITTIDWDSTGSQLLISGIFADNSVALYSAPSSGASKQVFNFTSFGASTLLSAAAGQGNYYYTYRDSTQILYAASFPLTNPTNVMKNKLACGTGSYLPNTLFNVSNKMFGTGVTTSSSDYSYFEVVSGACSITSLGLKPGSHVVAASFDPTSSNLYVSVTGSANQLVQFNTNTKTSTAVPINTVLSDVEVSY